MGLFLLSHSATKVVFLRAIVADEKKVLKQTEVTYLVVPKYDELSVKHLYSEALADLLVGSYLPNKD